MSKPPRQRLTLATFWFDGARERVQGWTDGSTWNNWGVPLFDERQLPAAIRALSEVGFDVERRGQTLWLKHEDDDHPDRGDYPAETHNGRRFWRIEGLTWNHELARGAHARGGRMREKHEPLDLPGWSVGYNDEISAHAATRRLGRDRLFVMTSDDREPRSLDEEVAVGLYFFDGDAWEQISYQDFPDVRSVIKLSLAELQLVIEHALSMDQARDLLVQEFDEWEEEDGAPSIMPWMATILKDAGVELESAGVHGAHHEAVEQILNASPAQILGYMTERSEAINA